MSSTPPDQATKPKPPKPEDKPFELFINEDLIPGITEALSKQGFPPVQINLSQGSRPVAGGDCWMIIGEINSERKFWICFDNDKITSSKTLAISDYCPEPSILESFLIDEKRITKALIISRLIQRLNGQKWLGAN